MKFKLFSISSSWGFKSQSVQVAELEQQVNAWLEQHPDIEIEGAHRVSHPTFGWSQLALALWYREATRRE